MSIWTKLVAGVSTRANLISYFNGNVDAPDTWIDYTPAVIGFTGMSWTTKKYRFLSPKCIQIVLIGTLTNVVNTVIRIPSPVGYAFDFTRFLCGGTCEATRSGAFYGGYLRNDTEGNLIMMSSPGPWLNTNPITWQANDIFAANVIIAVQ